MIPLSKKLSLRLICTFAICFFISSCETIKEEYGLTKKIDIPLGEYKGTAKSIQENASEEQEVVISFLPKEKGFQDAVGILVFENSSDRFLWRSTGNNKNLWNIMFLKDNTIFTNMNESFEFTGFIKASSLGNKLEGKLIKKADASEKQFFIEAEQIFLPELVVPKEAISISAGSEIALNAKKIDPQSSIVVLKNDTENAEEMTMSISNAQVKDDIFTFAIATTKEFEKGKYKAFIRREDGKESNAIDIEIK